MDKLVSDISHLLKGFQKRLEDYLPALEAEIDDLIAEKETDSMKIENTLDTLLSLCRHGLGNSIYIKLLEYYKTVDVEGAKFYWEEYDNLDDE